MEQCNTEPWIFRNKVNDKVSLMAGVYAGYIIVSGENNICDEFFSELEERLLVKHQGELKMYTIGCAFKRYWENRILEIHQRIFVENMMTTQYGITVVSNISASSPGVDRCPRVEGETGGNE